MRRSTTIPIASGEHFYGRWEVERYLQAGALSVVQADPEWCGGTSELVRIGTVASLHDVPVIPAWPQPACRRARHLQPVAHDLPPGRVPGEQDAALLPL